MIPQWLTDLIDLAPWFVAIAVVAFLAWKLLPVARKFIHFLDDVAGEPARPGVPARPGLMERMESMEKKQDDQAAALEVVRHEVTTNHGSSLKDAVKAAERDIRELKQTQAANTGLVAEIHQQVTGD